VAAALAILELPQETPSVATGQPLRARRPRVGPPDHAGLERRQRAVGVADLLARQVENRLTPAQLERWLIRSGFAVRVGPGLVAPTALAVEVVELLKSIR
jgi:hypothetical protein